VSGVRAERRSIYDEIEQSLQLAAQSLHEQISRYPVPITACDAQFNYLLERQAAIDAELAGLRTLGGAEAGGLATAARLLAFVESTTQLDAQFRRRACERLRELER
jgi:hypothetical protein